MIVKEYRQFQEVELMKFVHGLDVNGYDLEAGRHSRLLD